MDNTSRKNPENSINNFLNQNINLRFQISNSEFKYQNLDQISFLKLNNKFQNWNVNFQIQIIIFKITMSILRLN
jgi:hypothetical protein